MADNLWPAFRLLFTLLTGWRDGQERNALLYLLEENRVLRRQLRGQRLRLSDDDRHRLATQAYRLWRRRLREIASVVTLTRCFAGIASSSTGSGRAPDVPRVAVEC